MNLEDPAVEVNLKELSRTLAATSDPELIEGFLRSLLTPAETADIAARWALVKALDNKMLSGKLQRNWGFPSARLPGDPGN